MQRCFSPLCTPAAATTGLRRRAATRLAAASKRGIFADAVLEEENRLCREREDAKAAQETVQAEFLAIREDIRAIRKDAKAATRIAASAVVVALLLRLFDGGVP